MAVGWVWRTLPRTYVRGYGADDAASHGVQMRPPRIPSKYRVDGEREVVSNSRPSVQSGGVGVTTTVWVAVGSTHAISSLQVQAAHHDVWSGQIVMDNNSRLFVGNLSFQTLERDLQDHFSAAGVVTNVNLMLDKFTGKSRGFAFVEFNTPEEANNAVEMFQGKELGGRALTVNIARPREERPPGGGGGFRGGGGGGSGGGYRGDRGPGGGGDGWRGDRGGGGWRGDRGGDRY